MNSKCFHLFSFNTYERNVYIKEFTFCQFQFNPFNSLTRWKQKSHSPKVTSFRWPPFSSRQSVSLLRTSPITLWSISTGIRLTSCWIRCFNSWTVWGAGVLKTWDFRYPQRKKSHAERSGDPADHVMSPCLEITWLGNRFLTAATKSRAVWLVAPSWGVGGGERFFGYWMTSKLRTWEVLQHVNVTWSSHSYSLFSLIVKEVRIYNSKWRYRAPYCCFGSVMWSLMKFHGVCVRPVTEILFVKPG